MKTLDVACAIIVRNKKILVAQRSEVMSIPLKWEFPGGKINSNETEEQCLHRELKEELNIYVEIERKLSTVFYDYGHFKVNIIPFIASYKHGTISLLEHKEIKWIEKRELNHLEWVPADVLIIMELQSLDLPQYM